VTPQLCLLLLRPLVKIAHSFEPYSFLPQNGAMPLHLRDPFSLAIGNATQPPNIRNPAIDLKKRTARLSPAVQV
jgi:hypothetical protein